MTTPADPLLVDTDVLIDYLRDRVEAIDYIDNLPNPLFVSVITVGELYAGVRGGRGWVAAPRLWEKPRDRFSRCVNRCDRPVAKLDTCHP